MKRNKHSYCISPVIYKALDKYGNINPDYIPENSIEALQIIIDARRYCYHKGSYYLGVASRINKCNMVMAIIVLIESLLSLFNIIDISTVASITIFSSYLVYLFIFNNLRTKYFKKHTDMINKMNEIRYFIHATPVESLKTSIGTLDVVYEVLKEMVEEQKYGN